MLKALEATLRIVGTRILEWRGAGGERGEWQGTQFKAQADMWAHRELKSALSRLTPGVPVVSEEDSDDVAPRLADETYWLVDPIDGTASFAGGYSGFVTQAAMMTDGEPVLAAIYAPALERMYTAQKDQGAKLNGNALKRAVEDTAVTLVDNYPQPTGVAAAAFRDLRFRRYVESGSIGLKICLVADGSADLFFKDVVVRDWDIAAPRLVIEEVGGMISDINGMDIRISGRGRHEGLVAARSPGSCRKLVAWYRDHWKGGP